MTNDAYEPGSAKRDDYRPDACVCCLRIGGHYVGCVELEMGEVV